MVHVSVLTDDLRAEQAVLDALVDSLSAAEWERRTPAEGWDVRDSVSHLCYFDETARLALTDPQAFTLHADRVRTEGAGDTVLGRDMAPVELLARWRRSRVALLDAFAAADPCSRVPWYGPAMSVASFVTARLMETWAHGQDIADAVGAPPSVSDRLRHVCHIGVRARHYAFSVHGLTDPGNPVYVALTGPHGDPWTWGPPAADNQVVGEALDFALLVTQRRHCDDTGLHVSGPVARQWMAIAQAFAGPAGPGRRPGLGRVLGPAVNRAEGS